MLNAEETAHGSSDEDAGKESPAEREMVVVHFLFMDIVGYSKMPMERQAKAVFDLQALVHDTAVFRAHHPKGSMMALPRGDGMALVFLREVLAPVLCAMEIARELKIRPHVRVRMGLHTGPIFLGKDINGHDDVSGEGIVMAQRVMDCGDAGHILMSKAYAHQLECLSAWKPYVHPIGMCEVKHGQSVELFNFFTREVGAPYHPSKVLGQYASVVDRLRSSQPAARPSRLPQFAWGAVLLAVVAAFAWTYAPALRRLALPSPRVPFGGPGTSPAKGGYVGSGGDQYVPRTPPNPGPVGTPRSGGAASGGPQISDGRGDIDINTNSPSPLELTATLEETGNSLKPADPFDRNRDPGANEQAEPRNVEVRLVLPEGNAPVSDIRVEYTDARGRNTLLQRDNCAPGQAIDGRIEAYGTLLLVDVYENDSTIPTLKSAFQIPAR